MDATLTDRYVDAALRTIPEQKRADIGAELRASIADQVDARVESGEQPDAAERAVLTDLGDPEKLAAGYTDRQLHLIGPRYYLDWWRLLKLLLWIVLPCVAGGILLANLIAGTFSGGTIGTVVAALLTATVHIFFWTTLIFVILERTGHETMDAGPWTPDRLPAPRDRGAGLGDLVASIVFLLLVAGAVVWDHVIGLAFIDGSWTSVLDPSLWPWWITALFALMAAEAVVAVAAYARRGWTIGLVIAKGLVDLAITVPALWLLSQGRLVSSEVLAAAERSGGTGLVNVVVGVIAVAIVVVAVWDTVDAALKARRSTAERAAARI